MGSAADRGEGQGDGGDGAAEEGVPVSPRLMLTGLVVVPIPPEQVELQRKIAALTAHWIPIAAVKEFKKRQGKQ
jgi:hypothetical protein